MATVPMRYKSEDASSQQPPEFAIRPKRVEVGHKGSLLGEQTSQISSVHSHVRQHSPTRRLAVVSARGFLRQVQLRREAAEQLERNRREFEWLRANSVRYAGRWVALNGDQLLSAGDSAREVYAAVRRLNLDEPALVIKVEGLANLPFAGW